MAILKLQQQNVAVANAFTQVAITIPMRSNEVTIALRTLAATLYWYTISTANATNNLAGLPAVFGTIPPGNNRTIRGILGGQTIYVQSDTAAVVAEVDYYADT
jgi:hypothetical protein